MLSALVLIFGSVASALLVPEDTVKLNSLNALLSQGNYLPSLLLGNNQAQGASRLTKSESYENCPANKILQKIEVILLQLLNDEYDRNLASKEDGNLNTFTGVGEKLVLPLSKMNSLRELLESNNLKRKLKTKVTVKYELPSVEELSCKQALTQILQILKESNLKREYYRTCSPKDKCPTENVVDIKNAGDNNILNTAINQGNNYAPYKFPTLDTDQNSMKLNDVSESKQGFNSLLKYLLANKSKDIMEMLKNYRTSEQINLLNDTVSKELLEKLNAQSESVPNGMQNLQANNKFTYEQVGNPSIDTTNQNANISNLIAEALLYQTKSPVNINSNLDTKPDNLIVTATNDANVVSLIPSENAKNIQAEVSNGANSNIGINTGLQDKSVLTSNAQTQKQQTLMNIISSVSDNLKANTQNVTSSNILSVLDTAQPGEDYSKLVSNILQNQPNNQQTTNGNYQGPQPYYVNGQPVINGGKYWSPNAYPAGSVYQSPYQIGSASAYNTYYTNGQNPYQYPNLNLLNNSPKILNNQKMIYQTSYVKTNPFLANPNLVSNVKQIGQQFYSPFNFYNPQRLSGVTDQPKLNLATDNNGIVELTYMLKQPNPVVYQPVYFVKYHIPYDSFVNNLKELLAKKPHLRSDPAKLYQELIAVSKVAEVSPNLKGVGKEKLTQMVTTNGALVKTKVLKVNETLLDKQLETVRNFNSNLGPNEIVNVTYSIEVNANKQSENSVKSKVPSGVSNPSENYFKYLDILNQDKTLAKDLDTASTIPLNNKPVQNYETRNIPILG